MRATALAFIAASILSFTACGGDDTSTTGPGPGGTSGSGGTSGMGGSAGTAGSGGTAGTSGTGGSSGGGQAGTSPGDASTPMDVRADTPATTDAAADRSDGSADRASSDTPSSDGPSMDTSSPPDGSTQPDSAPPTDGSSGDAASDATTDAPAGDGSSTMVLTSTAFTEGMTIPAAHTCDGTNVSPPLSWTPGPPGTMSYAVVLTDKTNSLVHAGIYDIPASVTSLPMAVDKVAMPSNPAGSKQVLAYNNMAGYAGPCPGPTAHTYEFMLYAVDTATLPGVTTSQKGAMLVTALQAHDLATATLTGKASTSLR